MVYDSQRQRLVLFGGSIGLGFLSDTWEWNGSWTLRATSGPSARSGYAMAYDSQRGKTVLFGGYYYNGSHNYPADTWEWNGSAWVLRATSGPAGRENAAMAYDSQRDKIVLFGGRNSSGSLADTWEWNGSTWTQLVASGPAARYGPAMAFDAIHGNIILVGGLGGSDTWTLGGPGIPSFLATTLVYGTGCGTPAITIAPQAGSRPLIGRIQVSNIANAFAGTSWVALGWSDEIAGATPLPTPLDPFGFTGCTLWHSADIELAAGCTPTSWSTAQFSLFIPANLLLRGLSVFLQAYTLAPGYNPIGLVTSNGVELVIGDF